MYKGHNIKVSQRHCDEYSIDDDSVRIQVYHGTTSDSKNSIRKYGFDTKYTKHRNDHWLGNGVYFFQYELLAQWWALNCAKQKNNLFDGLIYTADITVEKSKFADLDNYDDIKKFQQFLLYFIADIEENVSFAYKIDLNKSESIQKIRGVFFDRFKTKYGYYVLKKTFTKTNSKYIGLNLSSINVEILNTFADALNFYILETQYCVSNKSCIKNIRCSSVIKAKYDLEVL
jgi:hypothetical protein